MNNPFTPFARPLYVMAKPAGSLCNLRCEYCYYLEKQYLYKDSAQSAGARFNMSDATLEEYIKQYLAAQPTPQAMFTWHGGEPLMRPLSFYKRVMELQKKHGAGMLIDNCIQTNGTLLTDEACRFFHDNGWLVGLSVDGPQKFHDEYRRTAQKGPSFRRVMQGIELLKRHNVEWNAMAVVNDYNADFPLEFYDFFRRIECKFIQFTPIVERIYNHSDGRHLASAADGTAVTELAAFSVDPEQWGKFLCEIFDQWVRNDVGEYFIQIFDSTLARWVGQEPSVCTMGETCGHAAVMEFNGDVYACDHFVFPEYKLGNIHERGIVEMVTSEKQVKFGMSKRSDLPSQCRKCRFTHICNGECPKNRFATTAEGEPGLNYLCKGYHKFFTHVAPYMDFMKDRLAAGEAPATIMAVADSIAAHQKYESER